MERDLIIVNSRNQSAGEVTARKERKGVKSSIVATNLRVKLPHERSVKPYNLVDKFTNFVHKFIGHLLLHSQGLKKCSPGILD